MKSSGIGDLAKVIIVIGLLFLAGGIAVLAISGFIGPEGTVIVEGKKILSKFSDFISGIGSFGREPESPEAGISQKANCEEIENEEAKEECKSKFNAGLIAKVASLVSELRAVKADSEGGKIWNRAELQSEKGIEIWVPLPEIKIRPEFEFNEEFLFLKWLDAKAKGNEIVLKSKWNDSGKEKLLQAKVRYPSSVEIENAKAKIAGKNADLPNIKAEISPEFQGFPIDDKKIHIKITGKLSGKENGPKVKLRIKGIESLEDIGKIISGKKGAKDIKIEILEVNATVNIKFEALR